MAAHPQARRARRRPGWDAEDHPQSVKTGRTNDEVKATPATRSGSARRRPPTAEIDLAAARAAAAAALIEPMLATLGHAAVQRPRLAVRDQVGRLPRPGGRRATARSRSSPATATTPRPTSRACWPRRPGSRRARRSSTARSSRSTTTVGRTSACSRSGARRRRTGRIDRASSTRRSTCSTSTAARCSTCRSRTASGCSGACSRTTPGSATRARRGEGLAFFEAAAAQRPRGHRRQAPPLPLRARPALDTPG